MHIRYSVFKERQFAVIYHGVIICILSSWKCDCCTSLQLPRELCSAQYL